MEDMSEGYALNHRKERVVPFEPHEFGVTIGMQVVLSIFSTCQCCTNVSSAWVSSYSHCWFGMCELHTLNRWGQYRLAV